jgi:hypothetical protein
MSGTVHHYKQRQIHLGEEYWSRRPGTQKVGGHPGRFAKTTTHRLERLWPQKSRDLALELG